MCSTEVREGERAVLCFQRSTSVKLEFVLLYKANYKSENLFTDLNLLENLGIQSW